MKKELTKLWNMGDIEDCMPETFGELKKNMESLITKNTFEAINSYVDSIQVYFTLGNNGLEIFVTTGIEFEVEELRDGKPTMITDTVCRTLPLEMLFTDFYKTRSEAQSEELEAGFVALENMIASKRKEFL